MTYVIGNSIIYTRGELMSTREMAYSIFKQLSEQQLKGFIAMFEDYYVKTPNDDQRELEERREIFESLQKLCRPMPDLDYSKELESYSEEKYGV